MPRVPNISVPLHSKHQLSRHTRISSGCQLRHEHGSFSPVGHLLHKKPNKRLCWLPSQKRSRKSKSTTDSQKQRVCSLLFFVLTMQTLLFEVWEDPVKRKFISTEYSIIKILCIPFSVIQIPQIKYSEYQRKVFRGKWNSTTGWAFCQRPSKKKTVIFMVPLKNSHTPGSKQWDWTY